MTIDKLSTKVDSTMGPLNQTLGYTGIELYQEAITRLKSAAFAYANSDTLEMDDATYDELSKRILVTEALHPDWVDGQLFSKQISAGVARSGGVSHATKMLSLDNVFSTEDLLGFCQRVVRLVGTSVSSWRIEPKLDGLALSVRYESGKLVALATRGDGQEGEDVTSAIGAVSNLPSRLTSNVSIEVRGELIMTDAAFTGANERRLASGEAPFANPRNAAAGTLRSSSRDPLISLTFFAYTLLEAGQESRDQSSAMEYAASLGIPVTPHAVLVSSPDEVVSAVTSLAVSRATLGFAIDGAVIKVNDLATRVLAGATTRAPRWAIAYKFPADTRETELLGIDVNVGRTGNLSFTARLAPVEVGGVTVSSASVHNPSVIISKQLRLADPALPTAVNQRVWVRRAGDVIPEITGPSFTPESTLAYEAPKVCPRCGGALLTEGLVWRCSKGRLCALPALITYAASRDCLDIDGLGPTIVAQLVDASLVTSVTDLFELKAEELERLDRVGPLLAAKIVSGITQARSLPMSRIFAALGVTMTGRSMSKRLASHFKTLPALRSASLDELMLVEGVGVSRGESILAELRLIKDDLDYLERHNIGQTDLAVIAPSSSPLVGTTWVISGQMSAELAGKSRNDVAGLLESLGAKVSSSLSSSTSFLLVGDHPGSKLQKANTLGVTVISESGFAATYL